MNGVNMNMRETGQPSKSRWKQARAVSRTARADVRTDRSPGSSVRRTWANSSSRLCFSTISRWTRSARRRSVFIRTPASRRLRSFSRVRSPTKRPPDRKASLSRGVEWMRAGGALAHWRCRRNRARQGLSVMDRASSGDGKHRIRSSVPRRRALPVARSGARDPWPLRDSREQSCRPNEHQPPSTLR